MHRIIKQLIIFFAIILITTDLFAVTIRLKDGQVINGKIISRNDYSLIVKTPYQTRRLTLNEIQSIEEENKKLEKLSILTKDGEIINGFLVEQDSMQVVYKLTEDSDSTKTMSKLDIVKMSNEEIRPVDLAVGFKAGVFYPANTGGADLSPSAIYLANIGISSIKIRPLRFFLETGYTQSKNKSESDRKLQIIPFILNSEYRLSPVWKIQVSPRVGLGMAITKYNSGENVEINGRVLVGTAGLKFVYPVRGRNFYAGLFTDYMMFLDSSGILNTAIGGICLEYRL